MNFLSQAPPEAHEAENPPPVSSPSPSPPPSPSTPRSLAPRLKESDKDGTKIPVNGTEGHAKAEGMERLSPARSPAHRQRPPSLPPSPAYISDEAAASEKGSMSSEEEGNGEDEEGHSEGAGSGETEAPQPTAQRKLNFIFDVRLYILRDFILKPQEFLPLIPFSYQLFLTLARIIRTRPKMRRMESPHLT